MSQQGLQTDFLECDCLVYAVAIAVTKLLQRQQGVRAKRDAWWTSLASRIAI